MPLQHNSSEAAFKSNVAAELAAKKPLDQALAIAYQIKRNDDIAKVKHLVGKIARGDCADSQVSDKYQAALRLAQKLAVQFDTVRADAEHWITLHPNGKGNGRGTPALINGAGQIIGGSGGKLNGKVVNPKSKSEGRAGTHEQHAPALWLGKAKDELPDNGGAKAVEQKKELTASEKAHELSKIAKTSQEHKAAKDAHAKVARDLPIDDPLQDEHWKQFYIHEKEIKVALANELSETAKTAEEHTAARNAHVVAANALSKSADPDRWAHHFEQHKVHEKAAKAMLRTEAKAVGGHIGASREKEFAKATPDEIGKRLTDKFGINFSNGAGTQSAEKEKKAAWKDYLAVRGESAEVKNAALEKYDAAKQREYEANKKHWVSGVTTYDINDTSTGAKNARKTIAAVDASLDSMVARGFDIKAAIGDAKVSFVPGTCRESGGVAWGGGRGHGHFTIAYDKNINPEFVANQKRLSANRAEKGLPKWVSMLDGDSQADHTVRHELAHALGLHPHINSPKKLRDLLVETHGANNNQGINDWIKKNISEYAAKNIHETDAELCAMVTSPNYVKGTLPPQFEKHVYDLFKYKEA